MNFYAQDWFDLASQGLHISLGFWGYREGAELVGAFVMAGAKADADAETGDAGGGAAGGGVGGSFSEQRLVEKLNKLNSSAASIQSILFSVVTFLHARKSRSLGVAVRFIFFWLSRPNMQIAMSMSRTAQEISLGILSGPVPFRAVLIVFLLVFWCT